MESAKEMRFISCPNCGGNHVVKAGFSFKRKGWRQRYRCRDCGRYFYGPYEVGWELLRDWYERVKERLFPRNIWRYVILRLYGEYLHIVRTEDAPREVRRKVEEIVSGLGGKRERWGWRVERERILEIVPLEEADKNER